jgi:hypothetical protein
LHLHSAGARRLTERSLRRIIQAVLRLEYRPEGWTVPDLDHLRRDHGVWYELIDGALIVRPPRSAQELAIINRLASTLRAQAPDDVIVAAAGGPRPEASSPPEDVDSPWVIELPEPGPDGWMVDDVPELLARTEVRTEIDGGLVLLAPQPTVRHLVVVENLRGLLGDVAEQAGLRLDHDRFRRVDVLVPKPARGGSLLSPHDVLLAVEVMDETSKLMDQLVKPVEYAAAGIPHFWRLELEPLSLVVHALDGDVYRETGRLDDEVLLDEPVILHFRLADLLL